jgi:large subunit ribosomal protein L22
MQVRSIYRYAKISAFKAREVTREIQGLPAVQALAQLKFIPKKAAPLIAKTLKSAIANAEQNNNLRPETLVIKEAVIGEAPTLNRIRPTARGSAHPIRKRTSHIRIVLTDEAPIISRSNRENSKNKKKATPKAAKKNSSKKAKPAAELVQTSEAVTESVADHQ